MSLIDDVLQNYRERLASRDSALQVVYTRRWMWVETALEAQYQSLAMDVAGTTLGMMLANVPAVFMGDKIAAKVSMTLVHAIAAAIFAVLGVLTLFNVGKLF